MARLLLSAWLSGARVCGQKKKKMFLNFPTTDSSEHREIDAPFRAYHDPFTVWVLSVKYLVWADGHLEGYCRGEKGLVWMRELQLSHLPSPGIMLGSYWSKLLGGVSERGEECEKMGPFSFFSDCVVCLHYIQE